MKIKRSTVPVCVCQMRIKKVQFKMEQKFKMGVENMSTL